MKVDENGHQRYHSDQHLYQLVCWPSMAATVAYIPKDSVCQNNQASSSPASAGTRTSDAANFIALQIQGTNVAVSIDAVLIAKARYPRCKSSATTPTLVIVQPARIRHEFRASASSLNQKVNGGAQRHRFVRGVAISGILLLTPAPRPKAAYLILRLVHIPQDGEPHFDPIGQKFHAFAPLVCVGLQSLCLGRR